MDIACRPFLRWNHTSKAKQCLLKVQSNYSCTTWKLMILVSLRKMTPFYEILDTVTCNKEDTMHESILWYIDNAILKSHQIDDFMIGINAGIQLMSNEFIESHTGSYLNHLLCIGQPPILIEPGINRLPYICHLVLHKTCQNANRFRDTDQMTCTWIGTPSWKYDSIGLSNTPHFAQHLSKADFPWQENMRRIYLVNWWIMSCTNYSKNRCIYLE